MTIKTTESARYKSDNPWLVFEGTSPDEIRAKIIATFGMTDVDDSLSLFDVTMNAQRIATRQSEIQGTLGGTTLKVESSRNGAPSPTGSASAAAPAAEPETNPLLAKVEEQTGVAALQRLWAENKAAFDADADLMAAYKAKGKALQSAGAA